MNIFDCLEELQAELFEKSYEEIEAKYYELCSTNVGGNETERIHNINLDTFQTQVKSSLQEAGCIVNEQSAKAIYFEYDMDNGWESTFFICDGYSSILEEDDDWASDWIDEIEGPSNKEFAQIYQENGFDATEKAKIITLFLIVRTLVAFVKAVKNIKIDVPLCIGFHDQDPIMRIKE
ncbi:hypothetical protein [Priestia megaterium]|uniref:hypothetical protein n=1 Tax=Priestia megaterium TaxID=1404 RepID=UPI00112E639A|nr:hypothetical protein [Priestia megaterium]TPF19093.1 hypothetical protein CBE78_07695 [Priestia megaterium]TPF23202.1 hypothetical protein CBE79_10205 [Priestia megaterium]